MRFAVPGGLLLALIAISFAPAAEAPVAPVLDPKVREQAVAAVKDLGAADAAARAKAEAALQEIGPAIAELIKPLVAAENKDVAAAAKRVLESPALDATLPRVRLTLGGGGVVEAVLFEDHAPNTVANFIELTEKKFYDGLIFHRVIEQFMVQGGDPTASGSGGPGYRFADEVNADDLGLNKITAKELTEKMGGKAPPPEVLGMTLKEIYEKQGYKFRADLKSKKVLRGTLAMANVGPDTNGSQFFITHVDCPWLDGKHTVFGQVTKGQVYVDQMRPNEKIEKIEVLSKREHPYKVKKIEEK